jgi:hypothetical protein
MQEYLLNISYITILFNMVMFGMCVYTGLEHRYVATTWPSPAKAIANNNG